MPIVVGTDFSEGSVQAVRIAALLAAKVGQELVLLHVSADRRAPLYIGTELEPLLEADRSRLAAAEALAKAESKVPVRSELLSGPVADALCAAAERERASLLVVAAMGEAQSHLGGVTEQVSRRAQVPALVLREPERLRAWLEHGTPLRVLVGSDLGKAARDAEAFVSFLRGAGPVELRIAYVAHPSVTHARYDLMPPVDYNRLAPAAEQLVMRDLERQGEVFEWRDQRKLSVIVGTSSADAHLAVEAERADLVLVGIRKRSWLAQAWYASVTRGLLRASPVSVACVPTRAAAVTNVQRYKKPSVVVVAIDFSEASDEAIWAAFGMADEGATIHVVHVVPVSFERDAHALATSREQLQERVPAAPPGRNVHAELLVGDVAAAVVGFARRVGAGLICVGSHGRSGAGALLMGSTSRDVLSQADVPVLVVPPAPL